MAETLTAHTNLLCVREIIEDERGATLRFKEGSQGQLPAGDVNYATYLRLARRSHENNYPVGVRFGDGAAILQVSRADNDVPTELWQRESDRVEVLFQGHDGVFRLKKDHPDYARIRGVLDEAVRQNTRVWFIAQKPDLSLVDVSCQECIAKRNDAKGA